jgi:hypothetical protein
MSDGLKTYKRVLQSAQMSGKPIGPQHHLYDKHQKQWAEKNKISKPLDRDKIKGKPLFDGLSDVEAQAILAELELLRIYQGVETKVKPSIQPVTKVRASSWVTGGARKKIG